MKRLLSCLVTIFVLVTITGNAAEIYVASNGSDTNPGTQLKPLATIQAALRKARELRRTNDASIADGIHIILKGATYFLQETITIHPEDAGTSSSPTLIEPALGEQPILSGGVQVTGWKKLAIALPGLAPTAKGKIWVTDVPSPSGGLFQFRQLWVNGQKAVRAKSSNGEQMHRILAWNKNDESCWIPTPEFPFIQQAQHTEMFIHQWWAIAVLRIRKMEVHGDSTKLYFHQPESKIQNDHPWPAPWISKETGNSAYYLVNALQFLDEPGEWYHDIASGKLYYWPRTNENLSTAKVIVPCTETLLRIQGNKENPVTNFAIKGISFQYTGWLRPSQQGHVPHQSGMYMTEAYKLRPAGTKEKPTLDNQAWIGRPAAAVEVSWANNTIFENCRFEHLASTGLDYNTGVHHNNIIGNLFKDIGGTAILAGVFSDEATEIHLPYNPKDDREVCDNIFISNNLITDAANEDWSCVGIGAGYVRHAVIEHNEVENVSYTGISMGWGWSPAANAMKNNKIYANKIHHYGKHNYDCAGIYTLSAQPGSVIIENYVDSIYKAPYAHLPSHWFYLYTDEGTSGVTVKNNWTPSQKYLQNANGPGNEWMNNGPAQSGMIKLVAGLEGNYPNLEKERTAYKIRQPINEEKPAVIELMVQTGQSIDIDKLKALLKKNNIDTTAIYQWQNHYVIFDKVADVLVMQGRLQNNFPEATVKVYHNLFYDFERKNCNDKSTAAVWDHIILTANLVPNEKLQKEYMDYHATQFEKWPEVSKGFCNASFQQLLVYRNGRQLVLVISIPKGESLDNLNPKTTENNPRVDEWNNLMKKYQEGIEGTKKGETWVFLKQLNH